MQIFYYELSRIAEKKQVWVFLLALLAAGLFITDSQVRSRTWDTSGISQQAYDAYRTELIDNAKKVTGISLFADKTGFSYRNSVCIQEAYKSCGDIRILQENPAGIQLLCETFSTDILVVLWIMALIYWIVLEERKNGQYLLHRTTRYGRSLLGKVKLLLLVLMGLSGMAVLMLERLILASCFFGLGDLQRSVQSVYPASVSHLNVLQMLVLSFFIKSLVCAFLAVFLYLTTQLVLNNRMLSILWLLLLLGSLLAYKLIAGNSWLVLVKEVNIWSFLNASLLITRYRNLDIFQHPVSYVTVFALVTAALFIVSLVPALFLYGRKTIVAVRERRMLFEPAVGHTSIWRHELYKLLTMGGWWLVFVMLLIGLYITKEEYRLYSSENEYYYWEYCSRLEGKWGEEQEAYLVNEEERFNKLLEIMFEGGEASLAAGTQYAVYQTYQQVCMQAENLRKIPDGQLLYDKGYNYLLLQTNANGYLRKGILLLVLLLFSMSMVWEMEYRYNQMKLIAATRAGKKRIRKTKNLACILMAMLLYLALMTELYVKIGLVFGYKGLSAPAACLPALSWVPADISIMGYLALQNLLLLVLTELVAMAIVKASAYLFR